MEKQGKTEHEKREKIEKRGVYKRYGDDSIKKV